MLYIKQAILGGSAAVVLIGSIRLIHTPVAEPATDLELARVAMLDGDWETALLGLERHLTWAPGDPAATLELIDAQSQHAAALCRDGQHIEARRLHDAACASWESARHAAMQLAAGSRLDGLVAMRESLAKMGAAIAADADAKAQRSLYEARQAADAADRRWPVPNDHDAVVRAIEHLRWVADRWELVDPATRDASRRVCEQLQSLVSAGAWRRLSAGTGLEHLAGS